MKRIRAFFLAMLLGMGALTAARAEDPASAVFYALWSDNAAEIRRVYDRMDETMQEQLAPQVLMTLKPQFTGMYGALESLGETVLASSGDVDVYELPVHLERASLQMQMAVRQEKIIGLYFSPLAVKTQEAQTETAINEREIVIGEGTPYPLPGILTLPENGDLLPLVVLVHGSGPNDRDETVGVTRMFYDLAQMLARYGIASIRYDKRTYVHGASFTSEQITCLTVREETIEDALLAAKLAGTLDRIDKDRIYLAGHSLGAMLAPRIATEGEGLFAGMVLMSGTPRTLLQIMIDQNQQVVDGLTGDVQRQQQELLDLYIAQAQQVLAMDGDKVKKETVFGQPAYYFWEMQQYDAVELLAQSGLPALIINGGKDFQIVDANGLKAWQLETDKMNNVTLAHMTDLNHLLMKYTGDPALQGTTAEYLTPAQLDEEAGDRIAQWILSH